MRIGKVENIRQVQIDKNLNKQNEKKHKKGEKGISFSDVLKSVSN
mgnify:CR=1 FL=1|jgi:hypothetical protein